MGRLSVVPLTWDFNQDFKLIKMIKAKRSPGYFLLSLLRVSSRSEIEESL